MPGLFVTFEGGEGSGKSTQVARLAARLGCEGAEFLAGVPGTIGGALAMNAGCYGGETWNHVVRVEVLTRDGRFEVRTPDDYGHHPAEIAAVIEAARGSFPGRRIVLAFQPHRYTRTRDLFEDFARVLSTVDALVLTDVYPAGEPPIVAADGRALARAIRVGGRVEPLFVDEVAGVAGALRALARDGDVVLIMGAGSIGQVAPQLAAGGP